MLTAQELRDIEHHLTVGYTVPAGVLIAIRDVDRLLADRKALVEALREITNVFIARNPSEETKDAALRKAALALQEDR